MALKCIFHKGLSHNLKWVPQFQQVAWASEVTVPAMTLHKIGKREIVGYGLNGEPSYIDRLDVPMPAVRFRENTPEIQALHEKEKGSWKKLTLEEKKVLYRASFCQTLAEIKAPTGRWKAVLGYTLMSVSVALWIFMLQKIYVYPPMPVTFQPDRQKAQLQKMIDLRMNPIDGPSSKYDYEKGKWKE